MSLLGKVAPAFLRRAFFVFSGVLLAATHASAAQAPAAPPLLQIGKPDAAEAQKLLAQFRQAGIPGTFYWEVQLLAQPPRGAEKTFRGRIWGGRNGEGAVFRVELTDAAGSVRRLLLQNGEHASVWRFLDGKVSKVEIEHWLEPLLPELELTAFDLQMPFLYWPGASVEQITRVLGRIAHQFVFRPPPDFAAKHPEIAAARAYFDTVANQPLQTELLGPRDRVLKRLSLISLKTVGQQMVPTAIDFRNEVSRSKTRLVVTGVALDLDLAPAVFTSASLAEAIPPPTESRVVRTNR